MYFHGWVQERCNSIANALELHLSYTKPSIWCWPCHLQNVNHLVQASICKIKRTQNMSKWYMYTFIYCQFWHEETGRQSTQKKYYTSGAHLTKYSSIITQIWWKFCFAVSQFLLVRSPQILYRLRQHSPLCHVQNFVSITQLQSRWEQNEISIKFRLRWKKIISETGPWTKLNLNHS